MSGSTLGTLFRVTNFGESHGPAIGCVVDGCPPGMELSEADIQPELDRRRPGTSRHVTQRNEADKVEILSGVFEGRTTGTPIALLIRNTDQRSKDYANLLDTFRPGHADYTYLHKYGLRDPRGGGRASARLTAPTVGAGAIARKWLREQHGTTLRRPHDADRRDRDPVRRLRARRRTTRSSPPTRATSPRLEAYVDELRKAGDSCGARIDVVASGVPVGLGEPLYDKLDADIAYAMMGINAVKGVEIGAGFASVAQRGTTHGDELTPEGFVSNNAGGVLGGISTGQDITVSHRDQADQLDPQPAPLDRPAPASRRRSRRSAATTRASASAPTPIAEAMLALVLMDHALRHRAQCGDVRVATPPIPARAP